MNNKSIYLFISIVIAVPLLSFTAIKWYQNNVAALPYYHKGISIESADDIHFTVPAFEFLNTDSGLVKSDFIRGKVGVINYFFTSCPTICPKMMSGMHRIQEAFGNDEQVRMLSLTVDPAHDTPTRLKKYAKKRSINLQQWQLGTGSKTDLYRFARNGLFITATDGGVDDGFIHSDKIVLIDNENHIRGYYDGTDGDEIDQLIKDIRRLKATPQSN